MTTIDTSGIDPSQPPLGNPTTEAVRDNFAEIIAQLDNAGSDIDDLGTLDAVLAGMEGVSINENEIHYATALNTYDVTSLTAYGRTVIGSADSSGLGILSDHVDAAQIDTPTFTTVQHNINVFHSAGIATGMVISDGGIGIIDVSAGTGFIRSADSDTSTLYSFDIAAVAGLALTDQQINYIYVEYNAGSPQYVVTTIERSDKHTNVFLGNVYRDGSVVHINTYRGYDVGDHAAKMISRLQATAPMAHESGAAISETGTRNIAITIGSFWEGFNRFTTDAQDTSAADTFRYFYDDGASGWTEIVTQTQIDNLQYDDGSGALAALTTNRYGVHWVYLATDSDIYVVYGTGNYLLAAAQSAQPGAVPPHIESHAKLIGKIIIRESSATMYSIESAFDTEFNGVGVNDHTNLTNIGTNTHTQIDAHLADTANAHQWVTSGNNIAYGVGNIGIGNSGFNSWNTSADVIEIGARTSLWNMVSTFLSNNVYYDAANYRYAENGAASQVSFSSSGDIGFDVAVSGTAGAVASLSRAFTVDNTGTVGVGISAPTTRLHVVDDGALNGVVARIAQDDQNIKGLLITNDTYDTDFSGYGISLLDSGSVDFSLPALAGGVYSFKAGTGAVTAMSIKDDGIVTIGSSAAESWNPSVSVVEVGGNSGIYSHETEQVNASFDILENAYFSAGSQYVYKTTDEAAHYQMTAGEHRFEVAPSGTAGNNISFVRALTIDANQNVEIGTAALATTATDGFLYIPTCAGPPTGAPTSKTGRVPLIFDTVNNNLYVYDGSWVSVALA